ncbi:hypothetical protein [Rheinheimera oceanensis]|uniref:hypothetical protein n=1 Tax=Rheinheimera oceanensis TaxID=2817449 RepID=UPI001BFD9752|nr:hypothetical protein [Rheinheimera oceanensis]
MALSIFVLGIDKFLQAIPVVAFFAYFITILVALPIYGVMLWKHWLKWWHFALLGVVPVLSLDLLGWLFSLGSEGGFITLRQHGIDLIVEGKRTLAGYVYLVIRLVFYSLTGIGAGLLFWFIAHRWHALTRPSN